MLKNNLFLSSKLILIIFFSLPIYKNVMANTLTMGLSGYIKDTCDISFSKGNTITLYDRTPQSIPFELYCSRPLEMTISSKYGGLKHEQKGLNIIEQYNVTLHVDDLNIHESRHSSQLLTPTKIESNSSSIPFLKQGFLRVALDNQLLYAGYYEDVIEIDVYPSINSASY